MEFAWADPAQAVGALARRLNPRLQNSSIFSRRFSSVSIYLPINGDPRQSDNPSVQTFRIRHGTGRCSPANASGSVPRAAKTPNSHQWIRPDNGAFAACTGVG